MNAKQVLGKLKAMGTAQNRKVYGRHGVTGPMFGVSYANLGKLAKQLKTDHALAVELWDSGNHDARVLATKIADPSALTAGRIEAWKRDLDNYVLTDALAGLVAHSPHAKKKMEQWTKAKGEWAGQAGWGLVTTLAMSSEGLSDTACKGYLKRIEREIHGAKNRVRHAMNMALCGIGMRNAVLQKQAVAVARKIGKVEVDHGETGCKTPDAESYIHRGRARRKAKG